MKRIWWILLAAPVFLQFQGKHAEFTGAWALDLKESVNLPREFKTVDAYLLDIRQSGDSITVLATMKGNGQTVPFPPFVYLANGKETYRNDTARRSERWMTAKWGADGKSVVMDTRIRVSPPNRPALELRQHDEWRRANDSTIAVAITQKLPAPDSTRTDSTRTEKRIFRKR